MILPGETGHIVEYDDVDTISKHLSNLLNNNELLNKMSEQARARVVNTFNIQKEADHLIKIYKQISN